MVGNKKMGVRGETIQEPHEGLPDSYKPSGLCPRCGKQSSFVIMGHMPITLPDHYQKISDINEIDYLDRVSVLLCRHCRQGTAVIEERWTGDYPSRVSKGGGTIYFRGINWWPLTEANLSKDVPVEIFEVFNEATMTLVANCPRSSVVMARRTLEAIAVDKGETSGTLFNRLEALNKKGILHPSLADWSTEVRLIGNKGAHFDPMEKVEIKDAKESFSICT